MVDIELVKTETLRIQKALHAAFATEGDDVSLEKYMGIVNGTLGFLADLTADLEGLTNEQRIEMTMDLAGMYLEVFSKYSDRFDGLKVYGVRDE